MTQNEKHRRTIDYNYPIDPEFLKKYNEELQLLTGMIHDCFINNPGSLLSPIIRQLIVKQAALVEQYLQKTQFVLAIDNCGDPLTLD